MSKVCPRCKVTYYIAEKHFHKNRLNKDGLSSICKECKKQEQVYYKSIKQVEKVTKLCAYEECNKKFKVLATSKLQKYCCSYCGDKARKFKNGKDSFKFKRNFNNRFRTKFEEKTALNNKKRWSDAELKQLIKLANENLSWQEVGIKLKRKSRSCMRKHSDILKKRNIKKDKI